MTKFFKLATLTFLLAGFVFTALAAAQAPDPADSVILESKVVDTANGACNSVRLRIKVWITNKDSLANMALPFLITPTSNGAFARLSRSAACAQTLVTHTFDFQYPQGAGPTNRLSSRISNYQRVNGVPPDTVLYAFTLSNPVDDEEKMPANLTRAVLGEIKFDSVKSNPSSGIFELDSGKVLANTLGFVTLAGNGLKPNFVKSVVTVNVPTDVRDIDKGRIPTVYNLAQNYPNPFNANTQISFALPKAGNARLDIYNVLGQKVGTLFNEYMNAGSKTVNWDGRDDNGIGVPSGVYFYQLVSQEYRQTKKMLLIK